jgi:hypothetical protein
LRKFKRITKFALALPKMRATVRRHFESTGYWDAIVCWRAC